MLRAKLLQKTSYLLKLSQKIPNPRFLLIASFTVFQVLHITSVSKAENYHISNDFSITVNDISGPGKNSSPLTKGLHYMNVFNLYSFGNIQDYNYNLNLGIKSTDDRAYDPKTHSLTNFQFRLTNKIHTFNLGDTFESLSQYTLTSAVKGFSYRFTSKTQQKLELTGLYGLAYPRWDSLWRDQKTSTVERQVYAAKIKGKITENLDLFLSHVRTNDRHRIYETNPLYETSVTAVGLEYRPLPGAFISSELALNSNKKSPQKNEPYREYHGYAFKISATGDKNPSRVTIEYERVTPDFETLLGSATPDREKIKFKWRYRYNPRITINTGFLWFRDNLEGQKQSGTTHYYKPDIGITFRRWLNRQYATLDIKYNLSITENNISRKDHNINFNYRDRFGIFDFDMNLGFVSYDSKGRTKTKSYEVLYNIKADTRIMRKDFILKPQVFLGLWSFRDELASKSDFIHEYSIGLGIDLPNYNVTTDLRFGFNKLEKDQGDDSQRSFGSVSIYYRPKLIQNIRHGALYLRGFINDYRFTTRLNNFREKSITCGFNVEF